MGDCRLCRQDAGFLRNVHRECEEANERGRRQMASLARNAATGDYAAERLVPELGRIAEASYIPSAGIREALLTGWEQAVTESLDDHLLTEAEEQALLEYADRFHISPAEQNRGNARTRIIQGSVLRDLLDGKLPEPPQIHGHLPFNLQKSERLVWVVDAVDYLEERVRRERVGSSHGVSVRVMRGLYYSPRTYKSRTVERVVTEKLDTGLLGLTNKHIYFAGESKRFRVAYSRIVAFEPYADGIGIMREAQTACPQSFITGDGWFIYNLTTNLAQL